MSMSTLKTMWEHHRTKRVDEKNDASGTGISAYRNYKNYYMIKMYLKLEKGSVEYSINFGGTIN